MCNPGASGKKLRASGLNPWRFYVCCTNKTSSPCWAELSQALCFLCHFSYLLKVLSAQCSEYWWEWSVALLQQARLSKTNLTKLHRQNAAFVSVVIHLCCHRASFSRVLYLCMWSVMKVLWALLFCKNINHVLSQELTKNLITWWNHDLIVSSWL